MSGSSAKTTLPRATIKALTKEFLPANVKVNGAVVNILVDCCTEFVRMVGMEAQVAADGANRKSVSGSNVLKALDVRWRAAVYGVRTAAAAAAAGA